MAGSYKHVAPSDGAWSLIENMGDASECVEQLLWLALYFARVSAKVDTVADADAVVKAVLDGVYYPMVRGERPKDDLLTAVDRVMHG